MPKDNSESLFVTPSTRRLIGRMEEAYRVRERRAALLGIVICSLLGRRFPKSEALPVSKRRRRPGAASHTRLMQMLAILLYTHNPKPSR